MLQRPPDTSTTNGRSQHEPLPLHERARATARVAFALILVALASWIAGDFLVPLAWSAILAMALWPVYERFAGPFSHASAAMPALIFTVLVGCVLFLPVGLAAYQMALQGEALLAWIAQSQESGISVPGWVAQLPLAADTLETWWRARLADPKAAAAWLQRFDVEGAAGWAKALGGELLTRSIMFLFALRPCSCCCATEHGLRA